MKNCQKAENSHISGDALDRIIIFISKIPYLDVLSRIHKAINIKLHRELTQRTVWSEGPTQSIIMDIFSIARLET